MHRPSQDDHLQTLGSVVRALLIEGEDVHLPGVGTLQIIHEESHVTPEEDGPSTLMPPRDTVTFKAEG